MDLEQTQRLIAKALDGGEGERGALMEHLRPRLVLWAASRLSPALRAKIEPEDVAQETLMAVHRALDRFRGNDERAFLAWLFQIAENRIRDLVDHFGAQKRQPAFRPSMTQTSPSTAAVRSEEVERVQRALSGLSDPHREVLRLRRFEHRETREVAELMGRSENAVRVLYCRALKALRTAMVGTAAGP